LLEFSFQILSNIIPAPILVDVIDKSDGVCDGAKLEVVVVSDAFDKVPLLKRHRMVNDSLKGELMEKIHAISLKTWTPAQYEHKK